MYLTQSNVIRGLAKQDYTMLREMCQYSNNLYNVAVYTIRQHYFENRQFLWYEKNYHACKKNENYSLLQAGVSQQILKVADRSFRAFFSLLKQVKSGDYSSKAVRLPHYREKGGLFSLILSTNAINIKNGFLTVPMSRGYAKSRNGHRIRIPVPDRLKDKTIQEVRICPIYGGRYFKIQYCYLEDPEPVKASPDRVLAIDLGLDIWPPALPIRGRRSLWTVVNSNPSTSIGTNAKPDSKALLPSRARRRRTSSVG